MSPAGYRRFSFEAIGTAWRIDTPVELSAEARAAVGRVIEEYDAVYSRFRPDSRISVLTGGSVDLLPSGEALGNLYRRLYRLTDGAMSPLVGGSRRWADGLHHVLDATTGQCVDTVVATWVLADDAIVADALATALFLVPPEVLLAEFDFDYVRIHSEGCAQYSSFLAGALF